MAMARMRRACLASAVRAASARNREILGSWRVISIADMLPAPRIIDVPHRVTFADAWESHGSQVLGRLVVSSRWRIYLRTCLGGFISKGKLQLRDETLGRGRGKPVEVGARDDIGRLRRQAERRRYDG